MKRTLCFRNVLTRKLRSFAAFPAFDLFAKVAVQCNFVLTAKWMHWLTLELKIYRRMQIYISRCSVTRSEIITRELFIGNLFLFTTRRRDCIKMEICIAQNFKTFVCKQLAQWNCNCCMFFKAISVENKRTLVSHDTFNFLVQRNRRVHWPLYFRGIVRAWLRFGNFPRDTLTRVSIAFGRLRIRPVIILRPRTPFHFSRWSHTFLQLLFLFIFLKERIVFQIEKESGRNDFIQENGSEIRSKIVYNFEQYWNFQIFKERS